MPSHSYPVDNGKYDFLLTITLDRCTVSIRENWGRDGGGELVYENVHEFSSEAEAEQFYLSQCRRDPYYRTPSDEALALMRGESVYLELTDGESPQFYEVRVVDSDVVACYGPVGTNGRTRRTTEMTPAVAVDVALNKLQGKKQKGYVRLPIAGSEGPPLLVTGPGTPVLGGITVQESEDLVWQSTRLKPGSVVRLMINRVHSLSFSFSVMAGEDIAYHFHPSVKADQVIQNTQIQQSWGLEERLPLPAETRWGRQFELAIALHPEDLIVYLDGSFLSRYRHRIPPTQLSGLRFVCDHGSFNIQSVQLAALVAAVPRPTKQKVQRE